MNDPWRPYRPNLRYCEKCGQPIDDLETVLDIMGLKVAGDSLIYNGLSLRLMRGETVLMRQLILRGRVSRDMFIAATGSEAETDIMNVYVSHLRGKLKKLQAPVYINTIWAWGYELRVLDGRPAHQTVAAADQAITVNGNTTGWHALTRKGIAAARAPSA